MSTYEGMSNHPLNAPITNIYPRPKHTVEHNTTDPSTTSSTAHRRRRPDLSTFFATLSEISNPEASRHRQHAVPVPGDISAAFYSLAEALEVMRREGGDVRTGAGVQEGGQGGEDLLTTMIQSLLSEADTPPREVEGVSEEFCDGTFSPPTYIER